MDDAFDSHFYDDLDASLTQGWALLERATADRRSPMRTVQVATVAEDGARVRTVVLRGAGREERCLRFHTDARSGKMAELEHQPAVEICAYDPKAKIQLRLRGAATLHRTDAVAEAAWTATAPYSRVCYRAAYAPGAPLDAPQEGDPTDAARNPADPEAGRDAFVAVTVEVTRIEWLYLAARGHRRAVFGWNGTAWQGQWLAP
jgi:hypothetical protein